MTISPVSAVNPVNELVPLPTLTFTQAMHVWIMHWKGEQESNIATRLGTNQLRVDAILKERQHVGSKERAQSLL